VVQIITIGSGRPPAALARLVFCERMGWTFAQYDATPVDELAAVWQIWELRRKFAKKK
jgi:hypothetical protein